MTTNILDNFFNGVKTKVQQIIKVPNVPLNPKRLQLQLESNEQIEIENDTINQTKNNVGTSGKNINLLDIHDEEIGLEQSIIKNFVNALKQKGIKLACFDFDDTIVNREYNREFNDPVNISKRLDRLFLKLAFHLMKNGIYITIVTYNLNPLIEDALKKTCQHRIPVFSRCDDQIKTGKTWHMDKSIQYCNHKLGVDYMNGLRSSNVILFDDNPENCEIAIRGGYNVVPNKSVITLDDLLRFIQSS